MVLRYNTTHYNQPKKSLPTNGAPLLAIEYAWLGYVLYSWKL
jgi:hypothetical protein